MQIPRGAEGKLAGVEEIPPDIKSGMSEEAQQQFVESYNQAFEKSPENALMEAWKKVKQLFDRDDQGIFSKRKQ
jgi:cation transport regulator ChaB